MATVYGRRRRPGTRRNRAVRGRVCGARGPIRCAWPLALARAGVTVFGLNYKDDADAARRFIGALGNPYTRIGADTRGRVAIDFGVYGVPETFVIDGTGRIVSRFAGPLARASLESDILPHLDIELPEASQ